MLLRITQAIGYLIELDHSTHRTIQACFVVTFCATAIILCVIYNYPLAQTVIEWSFGTMISTVGVYHLSTVVGRRASNGLTYNYSQKTVEESSQREPRHHDYNTSSN